MYWVRRLLVLGVACALVFGIAQMLDYRTDESGNELASSVAATPTASATEDRSPGPRRPRSAAEREQRKQERSRLAQPEGPCEDSDVLVTPIIGDAHLGSPVKIVLEVTTVESDACFFEVEPESVFLNIDGEEGTLWSSQQCPDAMPTETVVARRDKAARVPMWWDAKLSDDGCPSWRLWVDEPGGYTAIAAVRGSVTPVAIEFYLGGAVAETVTETATPTPTDKPSPKKDRDR